VEGLDFDEGGLDFSFGLAMIQAISVLNHSGLHVRETRRNEVAHDFLSMKSV